MLMLAVVGSATTAVYANKKSDVATKNVVVAVQKQQVTKSTDENNTNNITDEQAVKMATKAMKDYMGLDAKNFSKTAVMRDKGFVNGKISDKRKQEIIDDEKSVLKVHPELANKVQEEINKAISYEVDRHDLITVDFTQADGANGSNFVEIDAVTGKIINVTAINNLPNFSGLKADDAKVKDAANNFIKKIGLDSKVDFSKVTVDNNNGALSVVRIPLKDQSVSVKGTATVDLEVSLKDYTVMHYENDEELYYKVYFK